MSRKRIALIGGICFAGVIVAPVIVAQATPKHERTLRGVKLADVTYEEVTFDNTDQDIHLAGMMFLPEGDGPFPAVVVIHGAGNSRRDNAWYLTFTAYLQKQGIAVLLPDKRGCESSSGMWRTASFEDLATDALAGIAFLRDRYAGRISRIGVLGASQGGQIVPIVAMQSDDVSFAINLVGSAVPFHAALVYEENQNLREMGFLPGISHAIARVSSLYIRKAAQKDFWSAIGNYDPIPYWKKVPVRSLVLYGGADTNTPSMQSAERLNGLRRPNIRVIVYEGSGHPLEDPVERGDSYVRREALEAMRDFIFDAVRQPG